MRKEILDAFFQKLEGPSFRVRYWDEDTRNYGSGEPQVTIVFHRPIPVTMDLVNPILFIGEAYMDDLLDFEGDFDAVMRLAACNRETMAGEEGKLLGKAEKLVNAVKNKEQQKEEIQHHYDVGNDFYALWLDKTMSYSCGYFRRGTDTLYQAQLNKIDLALRKLHLQPGQKLLDIGSGWGWLLIRAARQYGVKATGITLSEEQYQATLERIRQFGLEGQVTVKLQDYLDLDPAEETFDRIVSVGMYEHVGRGNHHRYMQKAHDLLVEGGLSLLHTITGLREHGVNAWIHKYIFPGGYIPSVRETVSLLPDYDFHLLHGESLRLHYAKTLELWYENYRRHWELVESRYGRRFARMWELYLKSCAANFRVSGLNIHQLLFSKGLCNDLPMTFEHIYRAEPLQENEEIEGSLRREGAR